MFRKIFSENDKEILKHTSHLRRRPLGCRLLLLLHLARPRGPSTPGWPRWESPLRRGWHRRWSWRTPGGSGRAPRLAAGCSCAKGRQTRPLLRRRRRRHSLSRTGHGSWRRASASGDQTGRRRCWPLEEREEQPRPRALETKEKTLYIPICSQSGARLSRVQGTGGIFQALPAFPGAGPVPPQVLELRLLPEEQVQSRVEVGEASAALQQQARPALQQAVLLCVVLEDGHLK